MNSKEFSAAEKLRIFLFAGLLGLFVGRAPEYASLFLLVGTIGCIGMWYAKNFWIGVAATFFLSLGYASGWMGMQLQNDELPLHHHETISFSGRVVSFADKREKTNRVFVRTDHPRGKLLLVTSPETNLAYGDEILVSGKLAPPQNFGDFRYDKFLKRFGVQTIVQHPERVEIQARGKGSLLPHAAQSLREWMAQNLKMTLPIPHAPLAMGLLLGVKEELPSWTQNDFRNAGLMHLLVVSGFNVTIVIFLISFLLEKFGRRVALGGSLLALLFFLLVTGGEAPVLRASLMGGLVLFGRSMGRGADTRNLLLLCAGIIGLANPQILHSDIGFWLSFCATAGILFGTPVLERAFKWIPDFWKMRTILSVTLAAQLAVLPILGLTFGQFPFVGLVANVFAEPFVPLAMFFSFVSTIASALPLVIAKMVSIPAFVILEILLQIARFFGQVAPIFIPTLVAKLGLFLFTVFFLWANFSHTFEKILQDSEMARSRNNK